MTDTSKFTEEEKLVEGLKKGDEDAYRIFMRRYKGTVYGIIYSFSGATRFADDAAQEVFISVFRNIRRFKNNSSLSTWLYRITVNKCMDLFRRRRVKTIELNEFTEHASSAVAEKGGDKIVSEILERSNARRMLDSLPEKYRMPMVLREIEGFSYSEISNALGISVGKVKIMLFRAREKLRKFKL